MQAKVRKTISEHKLFSRGQAVLVGLSGGPDSVALLRILCGLRKSMRLRLGAVYINHGLRPKAARKEEAFCEDLCRELSVELQIVREKIKQLAEERSQGIEETGREFRYGVFEAIAKKEGFDRIAIAHHIDDRVETILLSLFRGTGRTGLTGMPIWRGNIVRPMFDCTKDEILQWLKSGGHEYCTDVSNRQSEYNRNFIRNKILPQLRGKVNPRVDRAILGMAETLAEEERYLSEVVARTLQEDTSRSLGGKLELELKNLRSYDLWLRRRLLRQCVYVAGDEAVILDRLTTERLDNWTGGRGKSMTLPGRLQVTKANGKIVFYREREPDYMEQLRPGKPCRLDWPPLEFKARIKKKPSRLPRRKSPKGIQVDRDKINLPLIVRSIRSGDRFTPLGMSGTKKVSDYLIDKKIPRVYRDEIPVVCDNKGIIWLVGLEIADRARIDKHTEEVLTVEYARRRDTDSKAL
jgi:tRNA(Ile)-lysidine synthase